MTELKTWLRVLLWTQLGVAAMTIGDLTGRLADRSWFLAGLDTIILAAVGFTAILYGPGAGWTHTDQHTWVEMQT